jgi:HSP20 family protein
MVRPKDPLQDLLNLQERINRLFEESLGPGRRGANDAPSFGAGAWAPLADAYETADGFVLLVELPGLEQEDVEIGVADDMVTIKGVRQLGGPMRPESFSRMERSHGPFSRTFRLGQPLDPARMSAELADGLLRLQLPKLHPRADWRSRPPHA